MRSLLLFSLLFCSSAAFAQQGDVKIVKDSRIDALVKAEGAATTITGYRIQLFFDNSKATVDDARSRFVAMFPKVDTYVTYTAPNYFLKVGDFRTQSDAEKVKAQSEASFPTSFIVKEAVNLPRIDQ